jgi:hypothetical protein
MHAEMSKKTGKNTVIENNNPDFITMEIKTELIPPPPNISVDRCIHSHWHINEKIFAELKNTGMPNNRVCDHCKLVFMWSDRHKTIISKAPKRRSLRG